uniref:(northern house mosquito) hypothetical protein n=1 Tax=Culex pipiens TaxID=7175 RepID=A0A8D8B4X4_CULPI
MHFSRSYPSATRRKPWWMICWRSLHRTNLPRCRWSSPSRRRIRLRWISAATMTMIIGKPTIMGATTARPRTSNRRWLSWHRTRTRTAVVAVAAAAAAAPMRRERKDPTVKAKTSRRKPKRPGSGEAGVVLDSTTTGRSSTSHGRATSANSPPSIGTPWNGTKTSTSSARIRSFPAQTAGKCSKRTMRCATTA